MSKQRMKIALLVFHWRGHFTHYALLLYKALGYCGEVTILGPREALFSEEFVSSFINEQPQLEIVQETEYQIARRLLTVEKYDYLFSNAIDSYWHRLLPWIYWCKVTGKMKASIGGILLGCEFSYLENKDLHWKWLKRFLLRQIAPYAYRSIFIIDEIAYNLLKLPERQAFHLLTDPIEEPPTQSKEQLRQELQWSLDDQILLCIGVIIPEKRVDLLIQAFLNTHPKRNQKLVIAGRFADGLEEQFRQLQQQSMYGENVFLENRWLSDNVLPKYISAADFLAVTYPHHFANASILFRAQKAGKPALVSSEGWIGRYASSNHCGVIVNPYDETEYTDGIMKLFYGGTLLVDKMAKDDHSEKKFIEQIVLLGNLC